MSDFARLKLSGLKELDGHLEQLGTELAAKALASAVRAAFKPVLEAAKALVPVYRGALRASLKLAVKKANGADPVIRVGIRIVGAKDSAGGALLGKDELPPARRWHFIEFGTAHQAAHPFLRPALDTNAAAVLALLKTELSKSIAKALKKKGKSA